MTTNEENLLKWDFNGQKSQNETMKIKKKYY